MTRKLSVGDKVICRLYNTPEGKFYGESWIGEILEIDQEAADYYYENIRLWPLTAGKKKPFRVSYPHLGDIWLHRKEIKRRVK